MCVETWCAADIMQLCVSNDVSGPYHPEIHFWPYFRPFEILLPLSCAITAYKPTRKSEHFSNHCRTVLGGFKITWRVNLLDTLSVVIQGSTCAFRHETSEAVKSLLLACQSKLLIWNKKLRTSAIQDLTSWSGSIMKPQAFALWTE